MIELCKINRLKVVRDTPQGLYLEETADDKLISSKKMLREVYEAENAETQVKANNKMPNNKTHLSKDEKRPSAALFTGKREDVLLPRTEVPEHIKLGDEMDVFIYLDSSDRYTATLRTPLIYIGGIACLKIVQVTDIGIFLDWGLEKNLLLPFRETVTPFYFDPLNDKVHQKAISSTSTRWHIEKHTGAHSFNNEKSNAKVFTSLSDEDKKWLAEGKELPVSLYIDKTGRPAATMRVYERLSIGEKYVTDSAVEATVIQINPGLGVFVAVDDKYFGMINIKEITGKVNVGDRIFGRVSGVRDDGKYMISLTQKAHLQMDNDAQLILKKLRSADGVLPLGDKSDPKAIMKELGMSKKAFKRAVGQLYKEGKVSPGAEELRITER